MTHRTLNRALGALALFVPMLVYAITVAPTVVFWDVGEFIAASYMMQVPHPPGSPLFLILVRIAMMVPFAADLAVRAHLVSACMSALSIMFTYLFTVRIIIAFRGMPENLADKITTYGSAFIGAMTLAFIGTYWDNSIEAEVYGASMFFLTAILWIAIRWTERAGQPGNEKHILLIAYLIGLSLGVHLLSLLAIFPVLMMLYFTRYEFSGTSFLKFCGVSLLIFFVVYPGIVKWMPGMMDGDFLGNRSVFWSVLPWAVLGGAVYGIYYSYVHKQRTLHIALLAGVMIFFGYTTYTSVIIRANENPPMNENDPSTLSRLTSYLGREQYGDAPFVSRRYSREPQHQGIYTNYTSDMDFLIRYQLNHMFFRYVGQNFIGSAGDTQDSGISARETWAIPLLLSMFGFFHHYRKDWKMWLTLVAAFIILGPVLALYQNQQEPQPRERDYFYVGAYFICAVWIAIGVSGIIDFLRERLSVASTAIAATCTVLFLGAAPANLVRVNLDSHDRRGNYVAWDYSYNILQTCEQDAILFTNGDNDTFPLWYLQDVEGIRRDVRIYNLSLGNTSWYIQQMKRKPYYAEARAVPISLSDKQISQIQPVQFDEARMSLPVTLDAYSRYGVTDSTEIQKGKIDFTMKPTLHFGSINAIRVQDILVKDIVFSNNWERPVYFAVTCSPDCKIGLDEYLWFNGLAWRLEPRKVMNQEAAVNIGILEKNLFGEPAGFSRGPQYGYKFRGIADPAVRYDENTTRLMVNYRSSFIRYALYHGNITNNREKALAALDRMEQVIPRSKIPMGWELTSDVAAFYHRYGRKDTYDALMAEVEPECLRAIELGQYSMGSYWNPFRVLLELYEVRNDHARSIDLLKKLQVMYPSDAALAERINVLQTKLTAQSQTQ